MSQRQPIVWIWDLFCTVPYYSAELVASLVRNGIRTTLVSGKYYLDPDCFRGIEAVRTAGIFDLAWRLKRSANLRRIVRVGEGLANLSFWAAKAMFWPPDALHVQFLGFSRHRLPFEKWFLRLARMRGILLVYTVHDLLPHDTGTRFQREFKRLYRLVDRVICHSAAASEQLQQRFGVNSGKISIIPHGPLFYEASDGELPAELGDLQGRVVLWQGLIFPYKGIDSLLRAWKLHKDRGGVGTLVIAGTGAPALLTLIEEETRRLGDAASVRLLFRFLTPAELVGVYRRADVVVYPYKQITTSGALMTGIALGKAIVATDLPAFREIITHDVNGMLVPPSDDAALAHCIDSLLQNTAKRQTVEGEVKKMHDGGAAWDRVAHQTKQVYGSFHRS